MKNITSRCTWHAGKIHKKTKKAYEAGHDGNEYGRAQQDHIDIEKFKENIYWYYDVDEGKVLMVRGGNGGVDFKKTEREFAKKQFKEGLDCVNERYKKSGHPEDVKTLNQHMKSKPPMEIMSELGNVDCEIDLATRGKILREATVKAMAFAQSTWGKNMQVLDMAFHADEGWIENENGEKEHLSNHMHSRVWFFVDGKDPQRDRKGNPILDENGQPKMCKVINQAAALEQMGFGVPKYQKGMTLEEMQDLVRDPNNWGEYARQTELYKFVQEYPELIKHPKAYNVTVAFTDFMRDKFINQLELAAQKHKINLTIDREADGETKSYRQLIKSGKITRKQLSEKDVLTDIDRVDEYQPVHEYKAAREEKRARDAQEAQRNAERAKEQAEQDLARVQGDVAAQEALRREEERKAKEAEKKKDAAQAGIELADDMKNIVQQSIQQNENGISNARDKVLEYIPEETKGMFSKKTIIPARVVVYESDWLEAHNRPAAPVLASELKFRTEMLDRTLKSSTAYINSTEREAQIEQEADERVAAAEQKTQQWKQKYQETKSEADKAYDYRDFYWKCIDVMSEQTGIDTHELMARVEATVDYDRALDWLDEGDYTLDEIIQEYKDRGKDRTVLMLEEDREKLQKRENRAWNSLSHQEQFAIAKKRADRHNAALKAAREERGHTGHDGLDGPTGR